MPERATGLDGERFGSGGEAIGGQRPRTLNKHQRMNHPGLVSKDQPRKKRQQATGFFLLLAELVEGRLVAQRAPPLRRHLVGLLDQVSRAAGSLDPDASIAARSAADCQITTD